MYHLNVTGQNIYIDDSGQGSPVLLLHSSGLSSQQWRRLRDLLNQSHRVLIPDFIGYGQSEPWHGGETFHFHRDVAVAEAVGSIANAPVHLVGHSYGGLIALQLGAGGRVPVASITLYEPVAFGVLFSLHDEEGIADLNRADASGRLSAPELAGTPEWAEQFVDYWNGPGSWSRMPPPRQAAFMASGRKIFEEVRSLTNDRTPHDVYARNSAPTLLLDGSESPASGRRTNLRLSETLPRARRETIQGAGHMGPLTHADLVNAHIASHIADVENRAGTHSPGANSPENHR